MIKRFALAAILLLFSILQMVFFSRYSWAPDMLVLFVVYAGIFGAPPEAIAAAAATGCIKGWFSSGGPLEWTFIFSFVAVLSWLSARLFYRHNPMLHFSMAVAGYSCLVILKVFSVNVFHGADLAVMAVIRDNLPSLLMTAVLAPLLFYVMSPLTTAGD